MQQASYDWTPSSSENEKNTYLSNEKPYHAQDHIYSIP